MSGYALITGRIVGPDGLGREGRVEFTPLAQYVAAEKDGRQVVVAAYAAGRLTANGYLVDSGEERAFRLMAPDALPEDERNYRVTIYVPGASEGRREYLAGITANTTVDLADIIAGRRIVDPSSTKVKSMGDGLLAPINPDDIVNLGNGLLAWKEGIDG